MPDQLLIRHPPERRPSPPREVTLCVGCCSLYTIGALLGAYLGGGLRRPPDALPFDPEHRIPLVRRFFIGLPNNQWYFWLSLAGVWLVAAMIQPLVILKTITGLRNPRDAFVIGILLLVLGGPLYGLVAWLVASLWMTLRHAGSVTRTDWDNHYRALLWAFLGTLLGLIAMVLLARAGYELARSPGHRTVSPAVVRQFAGDLADRLFSRPGSGSPAAVVWMERTDSGTDSSRAHPGGPTRGSRPTAGRRKGSA